MEQYERSLLELSKQQDKHLLETFKMSAIRDFRFNLDSIPDEQRTLRTSHHENESEIEPQEEESGGGGGGGEEEDEEEENE